MHVCDPRPGDTFGHIHFEKKNSSQQNPNFPQMRDWFPDGECVFMQNGASCHKTRSVTNFLAENNVDVLAWPGNIPDANPIENLWSIGLATQGSVRRIDIIAIKNSSAYILDSTIRFETHADRPHEVDSEKKQIYEPTIPFYKDKYSLSHIDVIGVMVGARDQSLFFNGYCDSDVRFELTTSVPQESRSREALRDGARRREERGVYYANATRGECARSCYLRSKGGRTLPNLLEKSVRSGDSQIIEKSYFPETVV
ncbi:hypothetical protein ANN_21980 [Periplaneta americana]|uniref:Tc1-like transposase DDE domain-containing protein n=1 Tax=Periplaneta americana TaxID=6978 RepID=A0ABQ8S6V9_PERAM|nr:hypothetical protein ANN_21980 [Periplaneta americana]